jgi:glycosyltransferase involved in cell wall biosynthesis
MEKKHLVSVVIPCFNHGAYIGEAIESVQAQTYQHHEIVIVNDGSTDSYTNDLLNSLDIDGCRVLHTENCGLPAARNTGIRATTGKYICCLDADDRYHPDYFKKAVEIFDKDRNKRFGAVGAWVRFFGSNDILWKTIGSNTPGFAPFLQGLRNNLQSGTMFRKICWEQIGGYNETLIEAMNSGYEDWDFWIRMLDKGYEWFCLEEPLIYYRQHEDSMVTKQDKNRSEILETLIRNNHGFYVKHMIPMLVSRDREVRDLQQEIERLKAQLARHVNSDEPEKEAHRTGLVKKLGLRVRKLLSLSA